MKSWRLHRAPPVPDSSDRPEHHSPSVHIDSPSELSALPEWHSVSEHVRSLILHVEKYGPTNGSVLSADLQRVHRRMCAELHWLPRPWAPIASQLRLRSGGKKIYAWINGKRLRVFALDKLLAGKREVGT